MSMSAQRNEKAKKRPNVSDLLSKMMALCLILPDYLNFTIFCPTRSLRFSQCSARTPDYSHGYLERRTKRHRFGLPLLSLGKQPPQIRRTVLPAPSLRIRTCTCDSHCETDTNDDASDPRSNLATSGSPDMSIHDRDLGTTTTDPDIIPLSQWKVELSHVAQATQHRNPLP